MIKCLQKFSCFIAVLAIIIGCKNSATDQNDLSGVVQGITNEPESPDAPEIYYEAASGYFSSWGTGINSKGFNYFISPGTKTWQSAGKRNLVNTSWWSSFGGLYAGGVPGGTVVNGLYQQAYTCEGPNTGAIGILTASGDAPNYIWTDLGEPIITQSVEFLIGGLIDVSLMVDFEGRLWLTHGCGSIWIVELDPNSMKLKEDPSNKAFNNVDGRWTFIADGGRNADDPTIEGSFIFPHEHNGTQYYYLFVTWGENSIDIWNKYEIRMGRATSPTGPYLDKNGARMDLEHGPGSGGTLLLDDKGSIIGDSRYQIPGHPGVCEYPVKGGGTKFVFSFHFHPDGGAQELLAAKQMHFDEEGWPVVTSIGFDPTKAGENSLLLKKHF